MLDNRSQSGAKSGPGSVPSSAVSPSPPELASGRPFERSRQYGSFPSLPALPSNAPPGYGLPLGQGAAFPGQGELIPSHPAGQPHALSSHEPVGLPPAEYGFQHTPTDGHRHWEQVGDLSSPSGSMNRPRDSLQSQYYRSSPTVPSTADFTPFPTNASSASPMQHQEGPFHYSIAQAQAWNQSQAARGMSFAPMQEIGPHGYMPSPVGYPPHSAHEGQPPISAPYSTSNATQASTLAPHPLPLGNTMGSYGQPQHPYMFQSQGPHSASSISSQHPYATNQWYGEHSSYGGSEQDLRSPINNRPFTSKPGQ
jgi:hypothetical protein